MNNYDEIYQKANIYFKENIMKNSKPINIDKKDLITLIAGLLLFIIPPIGIMLVVIAFSRIMMSLSGGMNKYKEMKQEIMTIFVKEYQENLEFYSNQGINENYYCNSGFKDKYNTYHSEDLITGQIIDNCNLQMAEVNSRYVIEHEQDNSASSRTVFHGLFTKIELNKPISLNFEIRKNKAMSDVVKNTQKLDMDSSEFEKIFDVKTEDKISTLRILTADVMQMLIDLKNENEVVPEIILNNNILYIRYEVGDVFELKFSKNDLDYEHFKKNFNIINFTLDLAKNLSKNLMEF